MTDPSELLHSLYSFVQEAVFEPITERPLQRQEIKPGVGEFAVTAVRDGPATASGGTHMVWFVEGYFATHHAPVTSPADLLLAAVKMASAMNRWWNEPVPQHEVGLITWTVDPSNMYVNPLTNSAGGTGVLTVETGFTLLLDLEVV